MALGCPPPRYSQGGTACARPLTVQALIGECFLLLERHLFTLAPRKSNQWPPRCCNSSLQPRWVEPATPKCCNPPDQTSDLPVLQSFIPASPQDRISSVCCHLANLVIAHQSLGRMSYDQAHHLTQWRRDRKNLYLPGFELETF